jgi:hypothetical protein
LELNFKVSPNLILASHITGVYDVNRSNTLADDDYSLVADWANSITQMGLQGIIFHNNFSEKTCELHQSDHVQFVKIEYDNRFNPNVFRYMLYAQFLNKYAHQIKNIFFTDVSDVVVLKNPFLDHFFIDNPWFIFCGDEPINLDNEWMQLHAKHLRDQIADYAKYEKASEQYKKDVAEFASNFLSKNAKKVGFEYDNEIRINFAHSGRMEFSFDADKIDGFPKRPTAPMKPNQSEWIGGKHLNRKEVLEQNLRVLRIHVCPCVFA